MKKQLLLIAILIAAGFGYKADAQVHVSVNIGTQPVWGPVGYDYVPFYYIPDMDAYYDVNRRQYVFLEGSRWVYMRSLPPRYSNYDLYHGYKVVVNEPSPWMHHDRYHTQYISYRNRHDQPVIRDSRDERYYANPQHPQHAVWQSHNPGHGNRPEQGRPDRGPQQGPGRASDHQQPQPQREAPQREGGRDHGHDNGNGRDNGGHGNGHDNGGGRDNGGHGNDHDKGGRH